VFAVAIVVHEFPPEAEYSKRTDETVRDPTADAVAPSATAEPRRTGPGSGNVTLGASLDTGRVRRFDVAVAEVESVTIARRSYVPSGTAVVSKLTENGAVVSVAILVHGPAPAGDRSWNSTDVTVLPDGTVGVARRATVPVRVVPGSSRQMDGAAGLTF
jgi:hypothetical protein